MVLLVKLYFNESNADTPLHKFRSLKNFCKGLLSINAVEAMIKKLKKTGPFESLTFREWKLVSKDMITNVAGAIDERNKMRLLEIVQIFAVIQC